MKKFLDILTVIVLVLLLIVTVMQIWKSAEARTTNAMAVDYCFEELADGSLYHYVCEK